MSTGALATMIVVLSLVAGGFIAGLVHIIWCGHNRGQGPGSSSADD